MGEVEILKNGAVYMMLFCFMYSYDSDGIPQHLCIPLLLLLCRRILNADAPQRLPSWADEFPSQVGSLVDKSMPLHEYMDKRDIRRQGRFTVLAMAAAKMAVAKGGLDIKNVDNDKFGVIIGSGIGGVEVFHIYP